MDFVEELRWRGMLHDITPGTEELLKKEKVKGYIGFDPTAISLHVGSLAQIMTLLHFQKAGHTPLVLVGGATGMVGDPSGKSKERNLLSEDVLNENLKGIQNQLERFLEFEKGINKAEIVNNYDWFKKLNFLDFIRDVGKHITINYMMAKDSVKNRMDGETGMSFTEFSYQLIQGFDFYYLWKEKNCVLQMGGSDQWGNILTGTELIRRKAGGDAFALTTQLIKKSDGTKFGKSEGGNIWLDATLTSPFKFYQFWLNTSDEDAEIFIKIFTLLNQGDVEKIISEHKTAPHLRNLQKVLAEDVTKRVHGKIALETANSTTDFLFANGSLEFLKGKSNEFILEVFEGIPQFEIDRELFNSSISIQDLLANHTSIFPSKGETKKMIAGGGVLLNREKISNSEINIGKELLLNDTYLIVQKGKKNYFLIKVI